jgi:hypothetical protein
VVGRLPQADVGMLMLNRVLFEIAQRFAAMLFQKARNMTEGEITW